jgi:hypothetical protein
MEINENQTKKTGYEEKRKKKMDKMLDNNIKIMTIMNKELAEKCKHGKYLLQHHQICA